MLAHMGKAEVINRASNRSAKTRSAILEAGGQLFASRGYSATGIRDIAAAADVNIALISYHFGGKAGLYDAILEDGITAARETLAKYSADPTATPEEQLVRGFAAALKSRPYLPAMITRDQLDPDRLLTASAANILRGFMTMTEEMLASLPLDHEARSWDTQIVHLSIVGPLSHFIVSTPMREKIAGKLDKPISLPTLEEFIIVQSAMLRRALRPDA